MSEKEVIEYAQVLFEGHGRALGLLMEVHRHLAGLPSRTIAVMGLTRWLQLANEYLDEHPSMELPGQHDGPEADDGNDDEPYHI